MSAKSNLFILILISCTLFYGVNVQEKEKAEDAVEKEFIESTENQSIGSSRSIYLKSKNGLSYPRISQNNLPAYPVTIKPISNLVRRLNLLHQSLQYYE